jgi:creatinine amidohydrolase
MGVFLSDLTWDEAGQYRNPGQVFVLPLGGGVKEHGGHLPMGTDMLECHSLADRLVEKADIVMLPMVNYEHFPAFVDWKGSVNIQQEHFVNFVREILIGLIEQGIRKIAILDYSFSSVFPLCNVVRDLTLEYREAQVILLRTFAMEGEARKVLESTKDGHAGEIETSIMLKDHPELVHMEEAHEEYREDIPGVFRNGFHNFYVSNRMETEYGVNGNPFLATAEKGGLLIDTTVDNMVKFLAAFRDAQKEEKPCTIL